MAARVDSLANFRNFSSSMKSGSSSPVYWFTGDENWFMDRSIPLIKSLVPDGMEDFNLDVLSGREARVSRVIDACRTFPMMADKRVVIVRDFMAMFERRKSAEGDDTEGGGSLHDELLLYLEKPNPSCVLALIDTTSVPATTKLGKALRDPNKCVSFQYDRLEGKDLVDWVNHMVKTEHQKSIEIDAIQLLLEISGNDLLDLSNELTKLAQYDKESKIITDTQVRLLATEHKQAAVFHVKDALFARNLDTLLEVGRIVVDAADTPASGIIGLNAYLTSQFITMWQIARLYDKGVAKPEIGRIIGKQGFYFDNLFRDAIKLRASQYPELFEIMLDADAAIKGMGIDDPQSILYITLKKLHKVYKNAA